MSAIVPVGARPALSSLHKLSDAGDLRHPYFERILLEALGCPLMTVSQRLWEFALAYAALDLAGALNGRKVGISFGAGFEQILYAVSGRVKKLHATDLYDEHSVWEEARAGDLSAELARRAPIPWNPGAVEIARMDMRAVGFPDHSFDFAYSISSIEHIGERDDFIAHLREARRVLKPDGIYVLTTTLLLLPETIRQTGCLLFAEPELRDLIREGGFATPGALDLRLSQDFGNTPSFPRGSLEIPPFLDNLYVPRIHILYRSEPFGACCLVLRPGDGAAPPAADRADAEESRHWLLALRDTYLDGLWREPVRVAPTFYDGFLRSHREYFAFTESFAFREGSFQWIVELGSVRTAFQGRVLLFLQAAPTIRPDQFAHQNHTFAALDLAPGQVARISVPFEAREEMGYSLVGRIDEGLGFPDSVTVTVGRIGAEHDSRSAGPRGS